MKYIVIVLALVSSLMSTVQAQSYRPTIQEITDRQARLQKIGTWTLAGWSATNLAVSGIAIGQAKGSARYFHEMNIYWNAVNLGIAGMGLVALRKKNQSATVSSAVKEHYTLQKTLLFNTGLDLAYVTSGLWLLDKSKTENIGVRQDRFRGFGQAVVVQGGFLLIFDLTNYFIHQSDNQRLHRVLDKVQLTGNGINMQF